jgi:hypothetical protein
MKINIRKLTDEGISDFQEYLDKTKSGESVEPPFHLIADPIKSQNAGLDVSIEQKIFSNRYDFGVYLWGKLNGVWKDEMRDNCGLWTWLALFYFEQLCPSKGPNRQEHYILSVGKWKIGNGHDYSYRHSVLTPVRLVKDFIESAPFFLCGTEKRPAGMDSMGDPVEQLFSRQYVMRNPNYLKLILKLYQDPETGRVKTGAMSDPKKKKLKSGKWSDAGKGGARRLITGVMPRLNLTFNIGELNPDDSLQLAGNEFSNSKYVP